MTLSEQARERLADVVDLQPTKNSTLQERWGLDGGSEVHAYLESELGEYYYRNGDSLICATPEAEALIGGEAVEGERLIDATPLQAAILDVLGGPDGEPRSVVATLQDLRDAGRDPTVDEVRSALRILVDKGTVERVRRTVPTFRLALDRESIRVREEADA
jgi:hypothetical protein